MLLFLPSKVAPPPCTQGNQAPWGQRRFNDVSAILDCKDSKSFPLLMGFSCFFEKKLKKKWKLQKKFVLLQHERNLFRMGAPFGTASDSLK